LADEAYAGGDDGAGVPASMADLFFTLIAVVVLMLLALVPAIRTPGALNPQKEAPWRAELEVDGRRPLVAVAERGGLRLTGEGERLVPLGTMLDDAALREALRPAVSGARPLLLLVTPEGGEAAFLFDALAARVGIAGLDQVRISRNCSFVADPSFRRFCDPAGWEDEP
jgi:hypothetical protein